MKKILFIFILVSIFSQNIYCEEVYDPNAYLQKKSFFEKVSFWKKIKSKKNQAKVVEKMPQTKQQWDEVAKSEPVYQRENPRINPEPNKKLTKVLPPSPYFVKYNSPPGEAEPDISMVKKNSTENSIGVVDENFTKMAYVSYFYYPNYNQIASKLLVLPLNMEETRIQRIENANILKASRINNFETNMDTLKDNYYSLLTILDWSYDSNFLLVKKKDGSPKSGLFRTTLYIVAVDKTGRNLGYKEIEFEKHIKKYWDDKSNIVLNLYRWDIKPLGFNAKKESEVIAYAWGYDNNGKKIFLGTWGANLKEGSVYLISEEYVSCDIATHGIVLEYSLP